MVLPKEERIDSVQQRSVSREPSVQSVLSCCIWQTEDAIFSPFHVTGGHSVLFKYLNPNLLLVSTVSEVINCAASMCCGVSMITTISSIQLWCVESLATEDTGVESCKLNERSAATLLATLLLSAVTEAAGWMQHSPFYKNRGTQADAGPSVHLYAIDSVTGHVAYHVAHPHSSGPTNLVLSENWVVHSYWSTRCHHSTCCMCTHDGWQQAPADRAVSAGTVGRHRGRRLDTNPDHQECQESVAYLRACCLLNYVCWVGKLLGTNTPKHVRSGGHFSTDSSAPRDELFSAFDKQAPLKEEQSFVLNTNIKSIGVTSTQLGITSKHLLIGSTADQLHAIPWQLINPRRPIAAPVEAEMAEGLIQYNAQLPLMSTNILS